MKLYSLCLHKVDNSTLTQLFYGSEEAARDCFDKLVAGVSSDSEKDTEVSLVCLGEFEPNFKSIINWRSENEEAQEVVSETKPEAV